MKRFLNKFEYNSPVVLTFAIVATAVYIVSAILPGQIMLRFFTYYGGFGLLDLLRLFLWPLGHASIAHLLGNLTFILLIGPLLEEKYSSSFLLFAMILTTLLIGIVHALFFTGGILGASGLVFMMIIMTSFTSAKEEEKDESTSSITSAAATQKKPKTDKIPLTFVLIAALYLGQEIYRGLFVENNVSELAHVIGGFAGILMVHIYRHYWKSSSKK